MSELEKLNKYDWTGIGWLRDFYADMIIQLEGGKRR